MRKPSPWDVFVRSLDLPRFVFLSPHRRVVAFGRAARGTPSRLRVGGIPFPDARGRAQAWSFSPAVAYVQDSPSDRWTRIGAPPRLAATPPASKPTGHGSPTSWRGASRARWARNVESALSAIRGGRLEKIVLARILEASLGRPPDVLRLLQVLQRRAPTQTVYYFEPSLGEAWIGSTPETLVRKTSRRIVLHALAGSRRIAGDGRTSRKARRALLGDPKERLEHDLVREHLRALLERTETPYREGPTRVRAFPHVLHLETRLEAIDSSGRTAFDWARLLHPTPAVAGTPPRTALHLIRRIERRARGWYAGTIGWTDSGGNGEFAVVLRTARIQGRSVRLYAGAGIVPGSVAGREWDETEAKFRVLKDAFASR